MSKGFTLMKLKDRKRKKSSPLYLLSRNGIVQRILVDINLRRRNKLAFPVAKSIDDAIRLAKWCRGWEIGVRPQLIGDIESQIKQAFDDTCEVVVCVTGWNENDGSPKWEVMKLV